MKTIPCKLCQYNSENTIMDEHQCNNGFIDMPTNTKEWAEQQQPFLYHKENEIIVFNVLKSFVKDIKSGRINVTEYEF